MSGTVGGEIRGSALEEAISSLQSENDGSSWVFEYGDGGLGYTADSVDSAGWSVWRDGHRGGVVHGAVTNLPELGIDSEELFDRLLRAPLQTARQIQGPFLIAAYDGSDRRHVVVTDKLGSRPCYYTETDPVQFASSTDVLLEAIDDPTLNHQGVSDMLLLGHMWGTRTLVEEIRALRPATVMEIVDGECRTERYWQPSYEELPPGERYLDELSDRYRQAVRRARNTMPDGAGIWLSGGLDSRTTAAQLVAGEDDPTDWLTAFTYDANPPTRDNPRIASKIARKLGIEFEEVPLVPDAFGEHFERVIESTDGMVRWNTTLNLSASYNVERPPPVMLEGMQGALLGDHLLRPHLTEFSDPVDCQLASEATTSVETVRSLLTVDVEPLRSLEKEVEDTSETSYRRRILDIHFKNYYNRSALASNQVMRDRVGSRVLQADGDYLDWCARLPTSYRVGTFPFTDSRVPYGTSRAKLGLVRRIDPELAEVTYERTKVKPSWPYPVHVAGFVGNVVGNRLRSKPTYGSGQLADFWIRDERTQIHRYVHDLVEDARSRSLFDGDAVAEVYEDHMDGSNNAGMLSQITTLEHWIQNHLD